METYLQALGYDVWKSVVTSYTPSKTPPMDVVEKEESEDNTIVMNVILSGLVCCAYVFIDVKIIMDMVNYSATTDRGGLEIMKTKVCRRIEG